MEGVPAAGVDIVDIDENLEAGVEKILPDNILVIAMS